MRDAMRMPRLGRRGEHEEFKQKKAEASFLAYPPRLAVAVLLEPNHSPLIRHAHFTAGLARKRGRAARGGGRPADVRSARSVASAV